MQKEKSVRAKIKEMAVGETLSFPLARYDYIVNCKTRLQFGTNLIWASSIDRENESVTLTRTK